MTVLLGWDAPSYHTTVLQIMPLFHIWNCCCTYVKTGQNGNSINLDFLVTKLHQPFCKLPSSADEVERKVRQIRLCIEVLRKHLNNHAQFPDYLFAAYKNLLVRIGASYDDIRLAKTASADKRKALAERLGIALGEADPDELNELDELLLTPSNDLDEGKLEYLFGLIDTCCDPVPDETASKPPDLPRLLEWRLAYLRELWLAQDWPTDAYSHGDLPVIDPDLIGSDDLRNQAPSELSDLLSHRRDWLKKCADDLEGMTYLPDPALPPRPDLDAMLDSLCKPPVNPYQALYGQNANPIVPWSASKVLIGQRDVLTKGAATAVTEAKAKITGEFRLSLEAFLRLMEIREIDEAWKKDHQKPDVSSDAWKEVYDILVQVQKKSLFAAWRAEETELQNTLTAAAKKHEVLFGPEFFWIAENEPDLTRWRASAEARQAWQQALRLRSQPPIIDPDLIGPADLARPTAGDYPAGILWERESQLSGWLGELRQVREDGAYISLRDPDVSFNFPQGVATRRSGDVYVADTGNHRILHFRPDGQSPEVWGKPGSKPGEWKPGPNPGEFNSPERLVVDADGNLYVADTGNHRIQKRGMVRS